MSDVSPISAKRRFQGAPQASEALTIETASVPMRHACGYLTQLYGLMVGAGLFSDYKLDVYDHMVQMSMRRFKAHALAPRQWMQLEREDGTGPWAFRYREMILRHDDLHTLMMIAQNRISMKERRVLPPLLRQGAAPV